MTRTAACAPCGHRVCTKLAGCAWRDTTPPTVVRTGNCPDCGVWLQNGEAEHHRVVHGGQGEWRPAS